jgi:PAB1-binding protein PBP1
LVKFYDGSKEEIKNEILNDHQYDRPYDQFAENEKKFNVKSTYNFNQYTTKLEKEKLTKNQKAKAKALTREIENN